ncbi:MAG: deoxyribodipyrimidine photo-lyase [Rhodospirillales bacterium]|nr:deoxyribodipyrimidine photo-lyase [Rhodospirillales bacterium]
MNLAAETDRPVILWFRHDLRLADQAALSAAIASGRPILALYVLDDVSPGTWRAGGASRWWLHHSLLRLGTRLARHGLTLVLRRGDARAVLTSVVRETGAVAIHAGGGVEPWLRALDRDLSAILDIPLHRHRTTTLFNPARILTASGTPYGVYTPFARACFAAMPAPPLPAPEGRLRGAVPIVSDRLGDWALLPQRPNWSAGWERQWHPGEDGAAAAMARFLAEGLGEYAARRDLPGGAFTSRLSPHLHFGEISAATLWHAAGAAADEAGQGLLTFRREVLWREFSHYLLYHHQSLPEAPLIARFSAMPWRQDAAGLAAWQRGRTGVPIVDAGMRELWTTGWMHNRVRMIVASFLVKHLLLPWQEGEGWFWDTLLDADLAANAASWQWVAGSGADAAPYFRVFNPVLQGRKFDADGAYVRRFVPELAGLPDAYLHAPWEAPAAILASAGVRLGVTYPAPIVDLAEGRARALAAFAAIRGEAGEHALQEADA